MINPSDCGTRKLTKAEAIDHEYWDPSGLLQKYDFNEVLLIHFRWSITADCLVINHIRRAPTKRPKLRLV